MSAASRLGYFLPPFPAARTSINTDALTPSGSRTMRPLFQTVQGTPYIRRWETGGQSLRSIDASSFRYNELRKPTIGLLNR